MSGDGFLSSDLENAVNDVAVACTEAADIYETAAGRHEGTGLGTELANHGQSRRQAAERLGHILAENYEGPIWPEPELELIHKAIAWTKAALSPHEIATLLADCRAGEERVRDTAAAALACDLPPALRTLVENLRRDADKKIAELGRHETE